MDHFKPESGSRRTTPNTPRGLIASWLERGHIPVPTAPGHILDALIIQIDEGALIGGKRIDALLPPALLYHKLHKTAHSGCIT